jgi:hypothetical protein
VRPIDHFFSKLASLESSLRSPAAGLPPKDRSRLEQDFSHLIAPVLGAAAAADLGHRTLDRIAAAPLALRTLGAMAAFFLGEYDGETMPLNHDDWQEIRETLEDVSGEMDINTLTALMGELLSRGILD